jgi:pimeloyl-ACP methyl ester esterase
MSALNVERVGHGRDLALIHGWGIGKSVWQPVIEELAQRFRVHLLDLPGYGTPEQRMDKQSWPGPGQQAHEQSVSGDVKCSSPFDALTNLSSCDMPSFIDTAAALADTLPEGCILCGWSLGSQLAMQAAVLRPGHFSRLILVASTPRFTQADDWPHAQTPALLDAFETAVGEDPGTTLKRFIALLNQGDTQARANARTLAHGLSDSKLPDAATLVRGLGWLRDVDLRQQLAAIAVPTLLIHGENDPLMPLPAAQWLKEQLPHAHLERFAGAAHAPFLNDPERFAKLIGDF